MDSHRGDGELRELVFIDGNPMSSQERRRNNKLARAHAAMFNRPRRTPSDSLRDRHSRGVAILPKSRMANHSAGPMESGQQERPALEQDPNSDVQEEEEQQQQQQSSIIRETIPLRSPSGSKSGAFGARPTRWTEPLLSVRTISPVTGALAIDTFEWGSEPASARMSNIRETHSNARPNRCSPLTRSSQRYVTAIPH